MAGVAEWPAVRPGYDPCCGRAWSTNRSREASMKRDQLNELIYQMRETERGGIQVYETALRCVLNEDLKEEWEEYLEQTQNHERIVLQLMEKLESDTQTH